MSSTTYTYGSAGQRWKWLLFGSVLAVAALAGVLALLTMQNVDDDDVVLEVYCAAGIKPPVDALVGRYTELYGAKVRMTHNNSGGLLTTIGVRKKGDLYIPADAYFIEKARKDGLVAETIPLARFRLVIAVKAGNPKRINSLDDLLRDDVRYVVCNVQAGAGKKAKVVLEAAGRWSAIEAGAKTFKPTVNDAAAAVQASNDLDAALIWSATTRQYGLDVVDIPEFKPSEATIHAAVLVGCEQPAAALRFARFLAAPETGNKEFAKRHYDPVPGDPWARVPELKVFCGGVNRQAVKPTLDAFQAREGCRVTAVFDGCGGLVNTIMASPAKPDAFLTCEASYLDKVAEFFGTPQDVSRTEIVFLLREEPRPGAEIRKLEDLTRPGLKIGITEPRHSALGARCVAMLKEAGLWDRVQPNIVVHAPTAHELVMQVEGHKKLDVALVYLANCQRLDDGLRAERIEHPLAHAVQNYAVGRASRFPQLAARLTAALLSEQSRREFEANGFKWLATDELR